MSSNIPWINDPCECTVCRKLRTSFDNAREAVKAADRSQASFQPILIAANAVGAAAQAVHCEHRAELYVDLQALAVGSAYAAEVRTSIRRQRSLTYTALGGFDSQSTDAAPCCTPCE